MAETKPTKVARWATDANRTLEPAAGEKDTGWIIDDEPPARMTNWLHNIAYRWFNWLNERMLDGVAAKDLEVTGADLTGTDEDGGDLTLSGGDATGDGSSDVEIKAAIAGAAGAAVRTPATFLKLDGALGLLNALKAWVGSGAGAGLEATGGATSGSGMRGTGGAPNGIGHEGIGAGTGPGAKGTGTNGHGLVAESDTTTPAKSALRIVPQDTDPSASPARGDEYVHTVDGVAYLHNGTIWVPQVGRRFASIADATPITTLGAQLFDVAHAIPANTLRIGSTIRVRGAIDITGVGGGGNVTFEVDIGTRRIVTSGTFAVGANSDVSFDALMTIRSLGATGAIWSHGVAFIGLGAGADVAHQAKPSSTTIDTTAALDVDVQCDFTANGNSATLKQLIVDIA